jgi:hypothetical protein
MKETSRESSVRKGWKSAEKETVFEGVLIPSDWDDIGSVTGISLNTTDEGEYEIEIMDGQMRKRLLKNLKRRVRLSGRINRDGTLRVSRFEVLDRLSREGTPDSDVDLPRSAGGNRF